jgi:hypothetical protein
VTNYGSGRQAQSGLTAPTHHSARSRVPRKQLESSSAFQGTHSRARAIVWLEEHDALHTHTLPCRLSQSIPWESAQEGWPNLPESTGPVEYGLRKSGALQITVMIFELQLGKLLNRQEW